MEIVNNLFELLSEKYHITKYAYSTDWLRKSKGYFAYLQSTNNTPSLDVLFGLYGEALRRKEMWKELARGKKDIDRTIYNEHAHFFTNIVSELENEIRQQSMTM
jgi:hypothetical protein